KSKAAKGKVVEVLGHYLPARDPAVFEFRRERIEHWVKMGAQPSDTVARLLKREGVAGMEHYIIPYKKQKKKGEEAAAPEAPKAEAKPEAKTEAAAPGDNEAKAA
ncbi:MAG: 30S ribosomal protein S16, partial [Patescibacteria group bacterium]